MTEKQRDLIEEYCFDNDVDYHYIENTGEILFLIDCDSDLQEFINYLISIDTTWEEFCEECNIDDVDFVEDYYINENTDEWFKYED